MKKVFTLILVSVFLLSLSLCVYAASTNYSFSSGTCYKSFKTSGSLTKSSSQTWSGYTVSVSSVSYSAGDNTKNYLIARPISADGTVLYSSAKTVQAGGSTAFTPNTSGSSANTVKFKIYNAYYSEQSDSTHNMVSRGSVSGTL